MMTEHSFSRCALIFNGHRVDGAGDGEVFTVAWGAELANNIRCADGHIVSNTIVSGDATIDVKLRHDSISNAVLNGFALATTIGPLALIMSDGTRWEDAQSRMQARPGAGIGQDAGMRTWRIFASALQFKPSAGVPTLPI